MGITRLNLPPIPLHGSTQMDNRTPEKVRFLAAAGFRQVVLARELSLQEIRRIHEACPETPLEVFVHGALLSLIHILPVALLHHSCISRFRLSALRAGLL